MDDRTVKTLLCYLLAVLVYCDRANGQIVDIHGPARVQTNLVFLDSFVPASMQVIAHATDLMKYEPIATQKPISQLPSTLPHKPAIYAPKFPVSSYQQRTTRRPWTKLGEQEYSDGGGYFNRYSNGGNPFSGDLVNREAESRSYKVNKTSIVADLDLLGVLTSSLYKQVNSLDEDDNTGNPVDKFTTNYDDDYKNEMDDYYYASAFLRKKRPPPTRAYVTLLSLYDNLNKEAKKLALSQYAGYSKRTLEELIRISRGTSASQLLDILSKIVERRDITQPQIVKKITTLIDDLKQPGSYINDALKDIPVLEYK